MPLIIIIIIIITYNISTEGQKNNIINMCGRACAQVEMMQLRSDNERMRRTIARNGLRVDDADTPDHSPGGDTGAAAAPSLQKKLSIGDPTTFGLSPLHLGCCLANCTFIRNVKETLHVQFAVLHLLRTNGNTRLTAPFPGLPG